MKFFFTSIFALFLVGTAICQQAVYNIPKTIRGDHATVTFEKVKSSTTRYYINYKIENTGDGVLVIDRSKASLVQNEGEMHPISGQYVLKSGQKKTIYNEFRVKPPIKANADQMDFTLYGIRYAAGNGTALKAEKLVLAEKATQTIGDFSVKVMDYNVYDDRVFAEVKCTYNGGINRAGKIDLTKIKVEGGDAEIVKKGDIVFNGKSYTFAMNIKPGGPEYKIDWTGVLQVLNLVEVKFETINIKSTTYKEPTENTADSTKQDNGNAKVGKKPATETCELSYSEFSTLKKDLSAEINSGGKPVAMANEFLIVKNCVNTAQVVELMGEFHLDAPRLEFAKMAYKFTSDKHKYHLAVKKLSYNKNKEALEEFLGEQ